MTDIQLQILAALQEINEELQILHWKFSSLEDILDETGSEYMTHEQICLPLGDNS